MKKTWEVVHEMDGENGEATCWCREIEHDKYGKYVWITENWDGTYEVEARPDGYMITLKVCKTLTSAKKWVTTYLA